MPPANSPAQNTPVFASRDALQPEDTDSEQQEHPRSSIPVYFRSALQDLSSPVTDYAATLALQPQRDAEPASLSLLRNSMMNDEADADALDRAARAERRQRQQQFFRERHDRERRHVEDAAQERQVQAHRAELDRQRHLSQEAWAESMSSRSHAAYGNNIPNQQSLYDWAPNSHESDEDELRRLMARMREEQPETHPDVIRSTAAANYQARRHRPERDAPHRSTSGQQEPSLRSAAILQSVSRNWRLSTRSRALMSRYIRDREQNAHTLPRHGSPASSQPPPQIQEPSLLDPHHRTETHQAVSATEPRWTSIINPEGHPDSLRRRYLENPSTKVSKFEHTIKYLHGLRYFDYDLDMYRANRQMRKRQLHIPLDILPDKHDFGTMKHVKPSPCPWLIAGMTFQGQQHAAPMNAAGPELHRIEHQDQRANIIEQRPPHQSMLNPSEPWLGRSLASSPQPLSVSPSPLSQSTDSWTVKVAIHAVDYTKMTLQGTMEAFNVPSYTANTLSPTHDTGSDSKTTFSTFVEGELIDFNNHTLLTEPERRFAAKTSPDIDAAYWRKLEPFAQLSDDEIERALLDQQWVEQRLMGEYILMRWKERSFVRPTYTDFSHICADLSDVTKNEADGGPKPRQTPLPSSNASFMPGADGNGYGLSISGFYYVSMRRVDGHCEGLYFDPQSSPYQRLHVQPTMGGLWTSGACELR